MIFWTLIFLADISFWEIFNMTVMMIFSKHINYFKNYSLTVAIDLEAIGLSFSMTVPAVQVLWINIE